MKASSGGADVADGAGIASPSWSGWCVALLPDPSTASIRDQIASGNKTTVIRAGYRAIAQSVRRADMLAPACRATAGVMVPLQTDALPLPTSGAHIGAMADH